MGDLSTAIFLMLFGMGGIFIVMLVLYAVSVLLLKYFPDKK